MKTAFKLLSIIIVIAILGIGAYFVLIHTDNLSSDFKTFYVKYEDHHLATESQATYILDTTHRFDIVYPFDFVNKDEKGYSVKIVPNVNTETAEYVIDGKYYAFSGLSDITAAFDIKCYDDYFTLTIPKDFTIKTILEKIYPDKTVEVDEEYLNTDAAFYTLVITSYDGVNQCNVNFGICDGLVKGVTLDITRIEF